MSLKRIFTKEEIQIIIDSYNNWESLSSIRKKSIGYTDIMGIKNKVGSTDVIEAVSDAVHKITKSVADRIIELNGDRTVSAVFVVGGGGKIPGFVGSLAEYLNLPYDRVALRGEEVLGDVTFLQDNIKKDPLLVTPIGICLNFYDQKNNFIFVNVNGERVKLYDNNKLTIVDAAIQVGFPNEKLFPRRGKEINFTVNGIKRMIRGELGEAAVVKLNGEIVGISHKIEQNDRIEIIESTIGKDAEFVIKQLAEYNSTISFIFNGQSILCPKFVIVNDKLVSEFYNVQDKDVVQILNYYTLEQVLKFMDIEYTGMIQVNNIPAGLDEKIYDNFTIQCDIKSEIPEEETAVYYKAKAVPKPASRELTVTVNNKSVTLSNKTDYIFVDIFDFYPFDLSTIKGSEVVTTLNGQRADFTTHLKENDVIELYWKK
jgi:sulfur carrier protein ThiS